MRAYRSGISRHLAASFPVTFATRGYSTRQRFVSHLIIYLYQKYLDKISKSSLASRLKKRSITRSVKRICLACAERRKNCSPTVYPLVPTPGTMEPVGEGATEGSSMSPKDSVIDGAAVFGLRALPSRRLHSPNGFPAAVATNSPSIAHQPIRPLAEAPAIGGEGGFTGILGNG